MLIRAGILHGVLTFHEPSDQHRISMAIGFNFYRKEDLRHNITYIQSFPCVGKRTNKCSAAECLFKAVKYLNEDFKGKVINQNFLSPVKGLFFI